MSTPTTRLRLELQALGSGLNTWGVQGLNGIFNVLDEALGGVKEITLTGNHTLTTTNYSSNESRFRNIKFIGSPGSAPTITIPATENWYLIENACGQTITISNSVTTGTLANGVVGYVRTNGGSTLSILPLLDQTNGKIVADNINSVNTVAGQITPANNIATLAGINADITTVANAAYKALVEVVGESTYKALVEVVGESGYKAFVEVVGASAYKALVETVGNAAYKSLVEVVGETNYKAVVEVVGNAAYKALVEVVGEATYKGKVEVVGDATYKGQIEALNDATYKAQLQDIATSPYKPLVETVGNATYKALVEVVGESTYKALVETVGNATYKALVEVVGESVYKGKVETVGNTSNMASVNTVANSMTSIGDFAKVYQVSTNNPTARGNGDTPLLAGDLAYVTSSNKLRTYNATSGAWEDAGSAVNGTSARFSYTATANQTTFPSSGSISYDANFADVYLNGVKLQNGTDVNVTSGTNVVLASGAAVGDIVDIVAYGSFNVANTYTQAQTNTLLAAKAPLASPNFSGTPQISGVDIATTASIPAGGNTVEMVASGTLANGDTVILNADGTVSSVSGVAGGALSTQTFQSSNVYIGSKGTFHSGENKVLIIYRDSGNSSHGKIVAGTVSGNTLSFGTPVTFHGQYTNDMDVTYDVNANLVVIAYESTGSQYGEVRTYSLSGTTFTAQGSPTRWNGTNSSGHVKIEYDPDAQGCVLFYRDISDNNYGKARYVGVSGSSITFGSAVTFNANLVTGIQITYNTTENHHLVIYNRTYGGATRQAWSTLTLSGSTVSNQSSALIFSSDTIGDFDLAHNPTINKVAISCVGQSVSPTAGYIVVGTPSTHAYTWTSAPSGNTRKFSSGSNTVDMTKITYNPDTGKFIVMYRDTGDSYKGKGVEITIDASSNVTVGSTETFFDFNNAYYYAPIYDTNADKLVVGYHDQSDGNKGKAAIILFSSTTLTTSNFLGFSNAAYTNGQTATIQVTGNVDDAQSALTINTTYFVQNDGTLGTSPSQIASVTAGKAIAATKILIA